MNLYQINLSKIKTYFSEKFDTVFLIYLFFNIFSLLAFSFVPILLYNKGYAIYQLIWMYTFITLIPVIVIPLLKKFSVKLCTLLGLLTYLLMVVVLFFFENNWFLLMYIILNGLSMVFYWISINYLFFYKLSGDRISGNRNAVNSSWYIYIGSFLSIFLPPLGAWIISSYGYSYLFVLSVLLMIIPLFITLRYLKNDIVDKEEFKVAVSKFNTLKTITVLEGALQFFVAVIISVYTIFFIKTESGYGLFLSYLALIGLIVGIILAYQSDKKRQRRKYIFVLFFVMALAIFGLMFVTDVKQWYLVMGLFSVVSTISFPLRLAITLDAKKVDLGFWKVREFYLNMGRVISLGIAGACVYFEVYWLMFLMYGLIVLIYPFLVKWKLREIK